MKEHNLRMFAVFVSAVLLVASFAACSDKPAAAKDAGVQTPASTAAPKAGEQTPAFTAAPEQPPLPTVADFRFTEPEGFTADPDNPYRLFSPDGSYIAVDILERDDSVLALTKESCTDRLAARWSESLGEAAEIYVDNFLLKKVDGSDGLRTAYFVESAGFWAYVLEVTAVADNTYRVGFVDITGDNAWKSDFNLSSRTIDIVWSDEADGPDYSVYQLCDNGTGLTIRLGNDMKYQKIDGMTMFYSGDNCMMSGLRESYADFTSAGLDPQAMTEAEYAAIIRESNALSEAFAPDRYGHLAATYVNNVNGSDFFYYATIRKGTDAFWVVNLACLLGQQDAWLPLFELWANSIAVD